MSKDQKIIEPTSEDIAWALNMTPLFYDAVLNPDRWQDVIAKIVGWFPGAKGGSFHLFQFPEIEKQYLHVNFGFSKAETELYMQFDDRLHGDPRNARFFASYPNKAVHCRQLVSDDEWYASPIYKRVFQPSNIDYSLLIAMFLEDEKLLFSGGIFRPKSAGCFDDHQLAKFNLLMPHLRRAAEVYARIVSLEEENSSLKSVLNAMSISTVLVNETGLIIETNDFGERLLKQGDGLQVVDGKIMHAAPGIQKQLKSALSNIAASAATGQPSKVHQFDAPRSGNKQPFRITVRALNDNANGLSGWVVNQMRAAIFISDPLQTCENQVEKLQRMFGLTQAEAKVLSHLVQGQRPSDIANQSGRSVETVRRHLKTVMSKTGTNSQADLIRLVLS